MVSGDGKFYLFESRCMPALSFRPSQPNSR